MQNYHFKTIPRKKFLEMSMKGGILVASSPLLMNHLISCAPSSVSAGGFDLDKVVRNKVIARALSRGGGDFADVYIENRVSRQIVMEESLLRSGLYEISQGAGVRVVSGDKTGFAYTSGAFIRLKGLPLQEMLNKS